MSLTKSDIVDELYRDSDFSKKESAKLVDLIFEIIKKTLVDGEKIKISGFGNFIIKNKAARTGRNPQTGETITISAKRVLSFKPSQVLKDGITNRHARKN